MTVQLTDAGKRYNRDWIFRHVNLIFETGSSYAITGANGSGKSTLLQLIAGSINASEGKCEWVQQSRPAAIDPEQRYLHLSIAAPYLELIEEMTASEFLRFHTSFKPFMNGIGIDETLAIVGLEKAAGKQIRYFSSGMKQRVKLIQAIFSDAPVLLLDEPCTNLDTVGYALYHQLIDTYCKSKLVIVSSNDLQEYDFCKERIQLSNYK